MGPEAAQEALTAVLDLTHGTCQLLKLVSHPLTHDGPPPAHVFSLVTHYPIADAWEARFPCVGDRIMGHETEHMGGRRPVMRERVRDKLQQLAGAVCEVKNGGECLLRSLRPHSGLKAREHLTDG